MRALILACLLTLSACGLTEQGTRVRNLAVNEGAKAYDEGLANAELFICRAASIGSVYRRYGRSRDLAEAWRTLCLGNSEADLLISSPGDKETAAP